MDYEKRSRNPMTWCQRQGKNVSSGGNTQPCLNCCRDVVAVTRQCSLEVKRENDHRNDLKIRVLMVVLLVWCMTGISEGGRLRQGQRLNNATEAQPFFSFPAICSVLGFLLLSQDGCSTRHCVHIHSRRGMDKRVRSRPAECVCFLRNT